jgi:hypothetical protein
MLKGAFHMPIHPRGIKLILSTLGVVIAASAWGQGDMKSNEVTDE